MKDASAFSVDLESAKVKFLQEMAQRFGLPDAGKAIRCLIDYAREHPDLHATIFGEVRCVDCG
jgi:hypothetical protein